MEIENNAATSGAAKITASIFGVLAGLGGLTHGIGEVLQGNVKPEGIIINSWTQGPIATNMGGEPGMTVVPNLLGTGILAILVSLAIIVWALTVRDKRGGRILLLLSVILLLVGGGFGPPLIGMLAGAAGTGIGASLTWWRKRLPTSARRILAGVWPWIFAIAVANGIFLVIGSVFAVYFFGLNNPDLFTNSFYLSIVLLLATILSGQAYEAHKLEKSVFVRNLPIEGTPASEAG
jgi:hypothetical protein